MALVLVTLFSMVFGELVPQFLGISAPLPTAKVVAAPVRVFSTVARPLISLLNGSANGFLRGQLLVMLILGVLYAVGLSAVGLNLGILIGVIAGLPVSYTHLDVYKRQGWR